MAVSRRMLMRMPLAPVALASAQVADILPTVSRVYPGSDGKPVYVPDEQGNIIPDWSYVGYGGGGTVIPTVPVRETVWPVAGDNTANVQAAVDKVSALPLDKLGFRGTAPDGLLPNGNAAEDPGQRRGAAGRGYGRHRHDLSWHGEFPRPTDPRD